MQRQASLALLALTFLTSAAGVSDSAAPERIRTHDNERAAGTFANGVLRLELETRIGKWYPHDKGGPSADMVAFSELGRPLQIPGPLIRVPAGTDVVVSITNALRDSTLTVHGLVSRPVAAGASAEPVKVAPGATREVRFRLDAPGAYYYWGTTMGRPLRLRTREDGQLSGAIIVDPPGAAVRPERVMVFGEWADSVGGEGAPVQRRLLLVINGRSWPHTSRLTQRVGDTVRWRMINTSAEVHPMHLHGFYFRVDSRGDGIRDTTYAGSARDMVVTERVPPGGTASITWVPERPGNWLFHCHFTAHFAARAPLGLRLAPAATNGAHARHAGNHALEGMSGLVLGVEVEPRRAGDSNGETASDAGRRRLRLLTRPAGGTEDAPYYAFTLHERGAEAPIDTTVRSGQPIILKRNEPVSITVVNRTPEPTAVHWHGIELDSYFDGVAGFSGSTRRLSPVIAPKDSFEARFTPPRSGTFIYHTHVDEPRQQPAGLSGALLVVDADRPYDPSTDIPVLITTPRSPETARRTVLINGREAAAPVELRAGVAHRFRLINITIGRPGIRVEVRRDTSLVQWRALAKDGADLPDEGRVTRPARQQISIGETYDFELTPREAGNMRLEVRTAAGVLIATMPLVVR
jgi:FtsP/CotA-like multicopper oxidase with cupredoxin domain